MADPVWRGVLIEESLTDTALLSKVDLAGRRTARLEGEPERGGFQFHNVEVPAEAMDEIVEQAQRTIKPGWYFHLVRGDRMTVIFRGRVFTITKGDVAELDAVVRYGVSQGVSEEQLQLTPLFDDPFG